MTTTDHCCTLAPYFEIPKENMDAFKALCEKFVEKTLGESDCLFYGFSFNGNQAHCREGYSGADGILAHLDNVGGLLHDALKIANLIRLEVHGPVSELNKLREPMSELKADFFELQYGFRR